MHTRAGSMRRLVVLATVAWCVGLGAHRARADTAADPSAGPRTLTFNPDRPERTRYFMITEFSTNYTHSGSDDRYDDFIFTDSFGLMRNVGERTALGASVDAHLARGHFQVAPTVRYRRWLQQRQSVELSFGYALGESEGLTGPILNARYSPSRFFHVQGGVVRVREVNYVYPYPGLSLETNTRLYGGVGLAGGAGPVVWALQAAGFVVLLALISNME